MNKNEKILRSAIMARVRSKNTSPEVKVRKLIFGLGYRYRLHSTKLPGKPDLVFPSRRKIIFVHGCFWHGHDCRAGRNKPSSNHEYWNKKLLRNYQRDQQNQVLLKEQGWRILIVWECELKSIDVVRDKIIRFLDKD